MRILYFGTSSFAIPALAALVDSPHAVVGIVTQPDRPAGRGGKLTSPPVQTWAGAHGLATLQPESCRAPEFLDAVRALAPDLLVVAAYGQFLPQALLDAEPKGAVNLHGSLLPKYRGAAPIQQAIWDGEAETGVCLMWMVKQMDAGDVIACARTPIEDADDAGTLSARLAEMAAALLTTWLPALEAGTAPRLPQDPALVTFAPSIPKEARGVNWGQPAIAIWRHIRALSPAPTAVAMFRGQPIKLLHAGIASKFVEQEGGTPGCIVELTDRPGLYVATGDGALELLEVQPAGKRPMSAADFRRGYRVTPGEQFA
jgi:methionyl-tRNA formyltransferase